MSLEQGLQLLSGLIQLMVLALIANFHILMIVPALWLGFLILQKIPLWFIPCSRHSYIPQFHNLPFSINGQLVATCSSLWSYCASQIHIIHFSNLYITYCHNRCTFLIPVRFFFNQMRLLIPSFLIHHDSGDPSAPFQVSIFKCQLRSFKL